jgi:Protein kinase domain
VEFLCYQDGETVKEIAHLDQCDFLPRILKLDVTETQVDEWSGKSFAEDLAGRADEGESDHAEHMIGDFELLSRLGKGGMGVVNRAWQPSLGRRVALKSVLPGDPKTEARFGREIRALGKAEHPNVVKVFTSGSVGARWFYVMELIEGTDLGGICQQLAGRNTSDIDGSHWLATQTSACSEARSKERILSTDRIQPGRSRCQGQRPWQRIAR